MIRRLIACAMVLLAGIGAAFAQGSGERVISLNLCTDQLALAWLPRERLAGVSFNAADPSISLLAGEVGETPLLRGSPEEVLAVNPGHVWMGEGQNPSLRHWLERRGIPTALLGHAESLAAIRADMRHVAQEWGVPERAEHVVAEQEEAFSASHFPREGVRLAVYHLRGFSDGQGTLLDEVIRRLGGVNVAVEYGGRGMYHLPLEALVAARPDIILLPGYGYNGRGSGDYARHPALLAGGAKLVELPGAYFTCPHLALASLARAIGKAAPDTPLPEGYTHGHE